jgi:NAD(P)-dependent dehydrogenase (short-subunit alcohol dehydrogenase family)
MLKGKNILVSGGTGHIGQAIVDLCADYGANVFFTYYKNEEGAQELLKGRSNIKGLKINLLNIGKINTGIAELCREINSLDILVNNAGISQVMPFSLLEEEDYDLLMGINLKGTVFLTKAVLRNMIKNKKGNIINIGSIAGHRMYDVPVHYAISKAALSGFTFSLAAEVKRFNIRVNSVVPGMIEGGISKWIPEELKNDFIKHCAAGRAGKAHEVAEVVCFLASDKSSYLNGQNILVDGGI